MALHSPLFLIHDLKQECEKNMVSSVTLLAGNVTSWSEMNRTYSTRGEVPLQCFSL